MMSSVQLLAEVLKVGHVTRLVIDEMSERVKRHALGLQLLARNKNAKLKKAMIINADSNLICSIAECAYNILKWNVRLTSCQKAKLRRYRKHLRALPNKGTSVVRRRSIMQIGGFLPAFLAPLASSVLLPLLQKLLQP